MDSQGTFAAGIPDGQPGARGCDQPGCSCGGSVLHTISRSNIMANGDLSDQEKDMWGDPPDLPENESAEAKKFVNRFGFENWAVAPGGLFDHARGTDWSKVGGYKSDEDYSRHFLELNRDGDGYHTSFINDAWKGWCAAVELYSGANARRCKMCGGKGWVGPSDDRYVCPCMNS